MTNHWVQQNSSEDPELLRTMFCLLLLLSHVETGDLSCPTNLIILRNLFLTYRESDINSRVFSLDCYQSYRGGPSCHTGLHRYHSQDGLEPGHTFLFNYVSDLLSNIPLWSRVWRSKRRTVWLRCIISSLGYNYQLVVRAELAIVSILRTARVSVSIKVWRHLKSHLWYPPSPLRTTGQTEPTYFLDSFFSSLNILSDVSSGWTLMVQIACLYSEQISCVLYWYLHQYSLLLRPHLTSRHTSRCPNFLASLKISK